MTRDEIKAMAEVDIRDVNPAELVDIADITVDTSLPKKQRLLNYIEQVKNPYCFKSNGMVVKISFAGKRSLEECLCSYISMS